jgi:hypothetical protein
MQNVVKTAAEGKIAGGTRKRAAPKCDPSSGRKSPKDLRCYSGRSGVTPHEQIIAENVNKWLTPIFFSGRWRFSLA